MVLAQILLGTETIIAEKVHLPVICVGLHTRTDLDGLFHAGYHLRPAASHLVEGTCLDKRIDDLFIDRPQIDVLAEIVQACKSSHLLPCGDYLFDGLFADSLDRGKTKAYQNGIVFMVVVLVINNREI